MPGEGAVVGGRGGERMFGWGRVGKKAWMWPLLSVAMSVSMCVGPGVIG